MIKTVKVLSNFTFSPKDKLPLARLSQGNGRWNDLRIVDEAKADYYLILNCPQYGGFYEPQKSVVMQMEPAWHREGLPFPYNDPAAFSDKFLYVHDTFRHHNPSEWHLSPSYEEFSKGTVDLKKTKMFSGVISALGYLEGHKKRLIFLKKIAERFPVDIYGRGHEPGFIPKGFPGRYLGELAAGEKDEGLFPYKYTFAAENTSEPGYFTEKLCDAILSECLCFYWGCPNAGDFLDPRAFISLDIDDHEKSLAMIERAIAEDEWSKRLPYIRQAKQKILNELQILPTLERILKETSARSTRKIVRFPVHPSAYFFSLRLRRKGARVIKAFIKALISIFRFSKAMFRKKKSEELIILVPYRDREENLKRFIPHIHAFLKNIKHRIVVIEQAGEGLFNHAKLLNVGFSLYQNEGAYFCFHDVDMLPESASCDYSYPVMPTHLSVYCSQFEYQSRPRYFGGVLLVNREDFRKVNGFSNQYWGWGGEDDDFKKRIDLTWTIPWGRREGKYHSIEQVAFGHPQAHENVKRSGNSQYHKNRIRLGFGEHLSYDPQTDGLSDLKYELLETIAGDGFVKHIVRL